MSRGGSGGGAAIFIDGMARVGRNRREVSGDDKDEEGEGVGRRPMEVVRPVRGRGSRGGGGVGGELPDTLMTWRGWGGRQMVMAAQLTLLVDVGGAVAEGGDEADGL